MLRVSSSCFALVALTGFLFIGPAFAYSTGETIPDELLPGPPPDEPGTIANEKITDWGTWGSMDAYPFGTFAFAYQQRMAKFNPAADNTALTGVKLFCSAPTVPLNYTKEVFSLVGQDGSWGPMVNCTEGDPLSGFALKVVPSRGSSFGFNLDRDDVSTVAFQGFSGAPDKKCTNSDGPQPEFKDRSGTAKWTKTVFCAEGFVVCGIQTQMDMSSLGIQIDKTGLNNIKLRCCDH